MRRTIAALLAVLALAPAVVACGGDSPPSPAPTAAPADATTPAPVETGDAVATATATAEPTATEAATPSPTGTPEAAAPPETTTPRAEGSAGGEDTPPLPASVREILEEVAEVRELEAPETMRALTVARANLYETYVELVSEEERRRMDETTVLYRLLGYLDEDEDLWDIQTSFLDLVLGFYSSDHKTLWVVTEEEGVGLEALTPSQRDTLVHEIIHALQDYHFDLNATFEAVKHSLDAELAFVSVVEGDAVIHTDLHSRRGLTLPAAGGLRFLGASHQLAGIPPTILREIYLPYTTGATWARGVLQDEGPEGLNALLREPPPASTLILHPELMSTGWAPEALAEASLPAEQVRASLGQGWREQSSGTLGEFHLVNYLIGNAPFSGGWLFAPTNRRAVDAAGGWAGDRYTLFENGDERVLLARVRFVDDGEAAQFAQTHRSVATRRADVVEDGGLTLATRSDGNVVGLVEPVGRDVIFAIGSNAEVVRAALAVLVGG